MMGQLLILVFISCLSTTIVQSGSLTRSEIRSTSFTMNWNPQSGVNYKISIVASGSSANASSALAATSPYKVTSTTDPAGASITPNTIYDIYLYSDQSVFFPKVPVDEFLGLETASAAPSNVQITNVQSTQFKVHWDHANDGAQVLTEYRVLYQTGGTTSHQSTADATASSLTIKELAANTHYSVTVVGWKDSAVFPDGEIFTDESNPPITQTTGISKPTGLTVGETTSLSIEVPWSAPSGGNAVIVTGYELSWTPADGAGSMTATTDGSTSTTISGLNSNTEYTIRVTATTSGSGNGDKSDAVTGTTAFSQPTSTSATSSSSSTIDVTWTTPPVGGGANSIIGYTVSWSTGSESPSTQNVDAAPFTIPSLNPNTAYSISVLATSAAGDGDKSDFAGTTVFGPVASLSTTSSSSSIDVSWSSPGVGGNAKKLSGYFITWSPPNSEGVISHNAAATATKYTIPNLDSNTDYDVKIYAKSDAGNGDKSDKTQSTVPLQASQPTNSSNPTINSITLQWTAVSGDSPSLKYNVKWNPSGSTGSIVSVVETSTTISGLTASTRYSFTVTAVNDGGSADPSESAMFSTFSNQPDLPSLSRPSTNSTTQIKVEWNKPSGGYDILDYVVDWWLSSSDGSMTSSGIVSGVTTSSYTIEGLTPGETYDVTVKARNSAGAGQPSSSVKHITNPDSVKRISLTQNSNLPDKELDLTWDKPNGTGDNILIEYNSTTSNVTNSISVEFNISQASLSVVPGNNYTVAVIVYSKEVASKEVHDIANSKPSEPEFVVKAFTNKLLVNWTTPDGYNDGLTIHLDGNKVTEVEDGNPQIIDGLDPYRNYTIEMYSWIKNVKGEVERSRTSPKSYATLPGPPPLSNPDLSLTENAESSASTITFVLPPNTFSEKNGPIEYYAVYLAFGDREKSTPNVKNFSTCENVTSGDECVTLWTDARPDQGNSRQNRNCETRQSSPITFIIGDGSVTLSPWNVEFQNYPLQPGTGYRVAVAAKTENQQMTATVWSSTVITGGNNDSAGLIVGLVCAAIVVVAGIVGGMFYYRRHNFQKRVKVVVMNVSLSHLSNTSNLNSFAEPTCDLTPMPSKKQNENSRSILKSEFDDYMNGMRKNSSYVPLTIEYEELKDVGVDQSTSEAIKSENYTKNRYKKNILPYDITRVKLEMIGDEPGTDFINANYIPGYSKENEFIATQGPLPTTKEDFWRMIWEQNSRTIVMLTQIVEGERVKCDHYWPYNNEPVVMAGIAVKLVVESTSKDSVYREILLSKDSEQRLVTQFHYTAWPDHGVPETAENLVKFVRYFQRQISRETRDSGPITVHCSAGVGRTGTFIAMDRLLQHMKDHDYVDIFGIVHEMRRHRVAMVQTIKQYILLHEMVQDVINEVYDARGEDPVYENTVQSPIYENAAFVDLHASLDSSDI
ncbi:receptor-type tyrosine-protein phosphatase H-like isoform X2 [Clavelina lepadiformis]|uniref:receptor-type tyrosine-protein phosphatase H-like isoform X2 n=1 Tax=Clavelina lepadiformis TaxID=159417 RepID=UPI0040428CAC